MTKLKKSNCDQNWIMTNLNLWRKKTLLVRTFWHLDNRWDILWEEFCDSCDVLNTDQNAQLFFKNCNYIVLLKKSVFGINFKAWEVLELKMLSRRWLNIFSSSTSGSPKLIPNQISYEVLYNYKFKKFQSILFSI